MYGFFREDNQICMILEYAEDRCLFHKLVGMVSVCLLRWNKRMLQNIRSK